MASALFTSWQAVLQVLDLVFGVSLLLYLFCTRSTHFHDNISTCFFLFSNLPFYLFMQERFYFGDHVLPYFETGIPLLKQRLHQLPDADNVGVVALYCSLVNFFSHYIGT